MSSAPHLPAKSCHLDTHRKVQSLPWLLVFLIIALLAGVTASLFVVAFVYPDYSANASVYFRDRRTASPVVSASIDAVAKRQMSQRIFSVYDTRQKINGYYPIGATVASAAILSSDGWAVMYLPTYVSGQEKNWEIFGSSLERAALQRVLFDPHFGLVYMKVSGTGFSVFSFAQVSTEDFPWSVTTFAKGKWEQAMITEIQNPHAEKAQNIFEMEQMYRMSTTEEDGRLVFNDQGQLLGFAAKDVVVVPGFWIENQLHAVLSKGIIPPAVSPFSGLFIERHIAQIGETSTGFLITDIKDSEQKKVLQPNDVIVNMNGAAVTPATFIAQYVEAIDSIAIKIVRDGVVKDIVLKK